MNTLSNSVFWSLDAILLLSCFPAAAWGYRPFVCIWKAPWQNVFIDECIRKGISSAAADWMSTTGLTFSFSLATISHK